MKSSAVTGTPSDQTARGLILYTAVWGSLLVSSALTSSSESSSSRKSGVVLQTRGHTFVISLTTAPVLLFGFLGLKPLAGSPAPPTTTVPPCCTSPPCGAACGRSVASEHPLARMAVRATSEARLLTVVPDVLMTDGSFRRRPCVVNVLTGRRRDVD